MTPLSTRMVEAAALSRYERMRKIYVRWPAWADADQRTKERWCENARLDLTAALALAEAEGGAVLCVVPGEVFVPQWDDDDKHEPWFQVGETYGRAKGHNQAIAATLAGRAWP